MDLSDIAKKTLYQLYLAGTHQGLVERDYRVEYALYGSRADRKKIHKKRAKNRRAFERKGLVEVGDGNHIHHIDGNVHNNKRHNLEVLTNCEHNKKHGLACVKTKGKKDKIR
jgi:hypothetical protein